MVSSRKMDGKKCDAPWDDKSIGIPFGDVLQFANWKIW